MLRRPAVATWQATFIICWLNLTYISIYQPRLCQFYKRKPKDNKSFGAQVILHTSESIFTRPGGFNQQKASKVLLFDPMEHSLRWGFLVHNTHLKALVDLCGTVPFLSFYSAAHHYLSTSADFRWSVIGSAAIASSASPLWEGWNWEDTHRGGTCTHSWTP